MYTVGFGRILLLPDTEFLFKVIFVVKFKRLNWRISGLILKIPDIRPNPSILYIASVKDHCYVWFIICPTSPFSSCQILSNAKLLGEERSRKVPKVKMYDRSVGDSTLPMLYYMLVITQKLQPKFSM